MSRRGGITGKVTGKQLEQGILGLGVKEGLPAIFAARRGQVLSRDSGCKSTGYPFSSLGSVAE